MNEKILPPIEEQVRLWETMQSSGAGASLKTAAIVDEIISLPKVQYFIAKRDFVTKDPTTLEVKRRAEILSRRDEPVLITGESGTGKEMIARILHGERTGMFVATNVCAVVDTLFESELFGHTKGAFTGAERERPGYIEQASGGTLFLDEIGDMPAQLQYKLLRVIRNRTFRRVGDNNERPVMCRIIAATHQHLPTLIDNGRFRLDLYQRLNVFALHIPPLRERPCDVELFIKDLVLHNTVIDYISSGARISGNIAQLLNVKLRYDVFNNIITQSDLS